MSYKNNQIFTITQMKIYFIVIRFNIDIKKTIAHMILHNSAHT